MKKLLIIFYILVTITCNATVYNYSATNADVVISNSTFGTPLTAGDVVVVDFRSGGYGYFSLVALTSGTTGFAPSRVITIRFINGAYFKARSDNTFTNFATSLNGIRIVGLNVLPRPEAALRFTGNATRYPKWIWFDSCATHQGRGLFTLDPSGGTNYGGDSNNMYAWWRISNSSYDSTWLNDGDNQAIQFFAPFSIGLNTFSRDIEIDHNSFNHYPAIGNPSIFIQLSLSFNVIIHHNTFANLGMTSNPVGHSSAINFYLCKVYGYQNHFGPNIIGDDFRGDNADLIHYAAYQGRGRVYNNITENKIKYAHVEARWDGIPSGYEIYVRKRAGPETWFITCYNMGTGATVGSFYSGSASIFDWYDNDTINLYNSTLIQLKPGDTTWNLSYVKTIDFAVAGPYGQINQSNNYLFETFAESGLINVIDYIPAITSTLYGGGIAPPSWITTDYNGNPRTILGRTDAGAVENQGIIPPTPTSIIKLIKYGRLRVQNN